MANENTLIILLLVLTLGLVIPELLKKIRLPFITLIIFSGAIFGHHGLDLVKPNDTIDFFGFLGMTFLMLMAGLETDLRALVKEKGKIITMALLNGGIPFLIGFVVTYLFGYNLTASLLVGIIFISSSVAIIIPSLKQAKQIKKEVVQIILAAVMVADIISLVALGFIFQNTQTIANLPLQIYFVVLILVIGALLYITPKISKYIIKKRFSFDEGYEKQLRFVIVTLIGILTLFILLGVHPILASFLAGLSLSRIVKKDKSGIIFAKLHTLGFGIFVPVFFFIVGMDMDLTLFASFDIKNVLMITLILCLIISKLFSGYVAGRLVKFSNKESWIFGSISITQLTTTLAVTYSAESLGLMDSSLVTTIIVLSIVTTFVGPVLTSYLGQRK